MSDAGSQDGENKPEEIIEEEPDFDLPRERLTSETVASGLSQIATTASKFFSQNYLAAFT